MIKAVYENFIQNYDGHRKMLEALKAGIQDRRRAHGFMELGAKVLDKVQAGTTLSLTFIVNSNVDFNRLRREPRR